MNIVLRPTTRQQIGTLAEKLIQIVEGDFLKAMDELTTLADQVGRGDLKQLRALLAERIGNDIKPMMWTAVALKLRIEQLPSASAEWAIKNMLERVEQWQKPLPGERIRFESVEAAIRTIMNDESLTEVLSAGQHQILVRSASQMQNALAQLRRLCHEAGRVHNMISPGGHER